MNKSLILLIVALVGTAIAEERKEPRVQKICQSPPGPIHLGGSSTTVTLQCWDNDRAVNASTIPNDVKSTPELVQLQPAILGTLLFELNVTMTVAKNSSLVAQLGQVSNATIVPGLHAVESSKGFRILIVGSNSTKTQYATLYFAKPINQTVSQIPAQPIFMNTTLVPQYNQTLFLNGNVTLTPGWVGTLRSKINQTLIPAQNNSQFVAQNVSVWPGWYLLDGYEGIRANPKFANGVQDFVTIFFENSQPKLNQNNVTGTTVPQHNQNLFRFENVTLTPGWVGQLKAPTQQILVPAGNSTQFERKTPVVVVPGSANLREYEGIRVTIKNSLNALEYVTVYFNEPKFPNITRLEEINKTVKVAEEAIALMELFD